ncbi:MAG TPA: ankyrin repeat domain-containing protein, partial [Spirochaetota bacterium]|nr:ankyrin repeat domain-containing protein [Spirochaetota bacterium]
QTEPKIIELLIKSGASVNDKNNDGETPLMRCAKYGKCPEIIMTLLKAKSNGKEKNLLGMTAFDLAQDNENIKGTEAYWELSNAR